MGTSNDQPGTPMCGLLVIDKPLGLGSTQVVSAVKRALREGGYAPTKKDMPKVGHGGTLDPLATGVLPVALGEATKLAGRMLDASKIYEFTIRFGRRPTGWMPKARWWQRAMCGPRSSRCWRCCRNSPVRSSRCRRLIPH